MSELEQKLGSVLNNPQMMQQILSMAQTLGAQQSQSSPDPPQEETNPTLDFDPRFLQNLARMASQSHVDQNQTALLHALSPYLSQQRVGKLEKAMRAARLAGVASSFLNAGGMNMLAGR